jgi:hypothetical protein
MITIIMDALMGIKDFKFVFMRLPVHGGGVPAPQSGTAMPPESPTPA